MYSREFAAFVKTFRALAVPAEFRYLFFVAGGGLAAENTMKAAFDWKAQKNRAHGTGGGADKILHFRDAFHGRTGYTLSVTKTDPTKTDDFPMFDWRRISSPYIDFPMDEEAVAAKEEVAFAEI
jgi:L-lysine 6-transaminase